MGAVRTFCDSVILILDLAPPRKKLVKQLTDTLEQWDEVHSDRQALEIATHAYQLFENRSTIVSHSFSSTVLKVLTHVAEKRTDIKVFQSVGYPVKEGVTMASAVAGLGMKVELISDGGLADAVQHCDIVLLGADSVTRTEVINKQGSLGIAIAARHFNVPCYVLVDSTKFIVSGAAPDILKQDPSELTLITRENLTVTNLYYDLTPLELFSGFVTEQGVLSLEELPAMFKVG
jgi:translation initiation factor 2B subunit (eIF-2B alpha/beta/delta family)